MKSAFICVHLWLISLAVPLLAQNAEISGFLTDPSGLAVQNATVVARSMDTGAAARARRNSR